MKKLDLKSEETLTYIIAGCTFVAVLVLLIDLQICRVLLKRADALELKVTNEEHKKNGTGLWQRVPEGVPDYAPETPTRNSGSAPVFRDLSGSHLVGNPGVETKGDLDEVAGNGSEPSPWDEFPISRPDTSAGIGGLEIPENGGSERE